MLTSARPTHTHRMRGLLLTLSLGLAACANDRVAGPDGGGLGRVSLDAAGPTTLASLGDTIAITPRAMSRAGVPIDVGVIAMRLSAPGILEDVGNGRFRAVGNGQVTIRASVDTALSGVVSGGYYVAGAADSVVVTVQQVAVSLTMLASIDSIFHAVGELRQLPVQLADARGNPLLNGTPPVTFSAADSGVVRFDGTGTLRSVKDGTTQVLARSGTLVAARTFLVRATRQHTSCMTYRRRRTAQQLCVSVDFVVRAAAPVTP